MARLSRDRNPAGNQSAMVTLPFRPGLRWQVRFRLFVEVALRAFGTTSHSVNETV